jgi:YidC/Oxa1 family membrane protein insertase
MWTDFVDLVRATIFSGTHLLGGSLGASIIVISALVRLAMLPLVLRSARHARQQQAKLATLQPQLERLRERFKADPARLWAETRAVYRKHDIQLATPGSLASVAIQLPLLGALFAAVRTGLGARTRFLWVADLSRMDALLAVGVTGFAAFAATLTPTAPGTPLTPRTLAFMVGVGTLVFLWSASSAVALSVGAGSAVQLLQNWLLRRDIVREARAA